MLGGGDGGGYVFFIAVWAEAKERKKRNWNREMKLRYSESSSGVVFGIFWRLEERKVFMLLSTKWWMNGGVARCECFSGIYWEKCGGARNEKDKEKIKLKWECEEVDIEYFGEVIVRFCWLDLKMKNKKKVGYMDFLKNKKCVKFYEKIFSNYELVFSSFLYILWMDRFPASWIFMNT